METGLLKDCLRSAGSLAASVVANRCWNMIHIYEVDGVRGHRTEFLNWNDSPSPKLAGCPCAKYFMGN